MGYYDFGAAKTPPSTVSAQLGAFIRYGDTRVKRIKLDNGSYSYYLTQNEQEIGIEIITGTTTTVKPLVARSYNERDLHKLLSSYLKNTKTYSKTIFHEQSKFANDNNQIWTHPDMVDWLINTKILAPLEAANHLSDFPDFNDVTKLGSGKEMVDRLSNLIAIFETPAEAILVDRFCFI